MYIDEKYWNHYIGETDDSLLLIDYLAQKEKEKISVGEIFSDLGLDQLNGNYRQPDNPLVYTNAEGWEEAFTYAIDIITDLAAILLECKVNGSVDLCELAGTDLDTSVPEICVIATPEEHTLIDNTLMDFASAPLAYDLSELCPEEVMLEIAALCNDLRKELYH